MSLLKYLSRLSEKLLADVRLVCTECGYVEEIPARERKLFILDLYGRTCPRCKEKYLIPG